MSWAVMRSLSPALRTLPSSTVATCNCSPTLRKMLSSVLPLKAKQELRPGTRKPGTWASTLSSSSVMPSLRYSSALSTLMLTNGSTAMDFWSAALVVAAAAGETGGLVGGFPACPGGWKHHQPTPPRASGTTNPTTTRRALGFDVDSEPELAVIGACCCQGSTTR